MKSGSLVPDAMILRLITHELKSRGWLYPASTPQPYVLSSTSAFAADAAASADTDLFVEPSLATSQIPLVASESPSASFILDGFPRTSSQAAAVDSIIPINFVVSLNTPASVILDRIRNRWVHEPSGRVYNTTFNPPKVAGRDDVTGEPLTKREDDKEEVWMERLRKFEETSKPLIEHYRGKGLLWEVQGNTSDEITPVLVKEFERRFTLPN